jgi:hypothetical protein
VLLRFCHFSSFKVRLSDMLVRPMCASYNCFEAVHSMYRTSLTAFVHLKRQEEQ